MCKQIWQRVLCGLVALGGVVPSPAAWGDERTIVKIGVILPLSGDMAAVGSASRDAVRMALEDGNKTSRHEYQVVFEDDRLTPTEVAKAAQKLISVDRVSALVSTWSYGGRIVAPLAERAKVPHIGVAWDHMVADGEYSFLHLTPPAEFMKAFLEVFKRIGVKRVALLGVEESGSVYALDEFVRMAPDYGVEVVYRDSVLWDIKDFESVVTKIAGVKPEYLVFNLGGEALNGALLKSLRTQRVPFRYTAITSFDVIDPSLIEGLWYVSDSYLPDDFSEQFKARYGHTMRYGVGNFYEAIKLFIFAFDRSASASSQEAKDVLRGIRDQPSVLGPTSVDQKGIFSYPPRYIRIVEGKRTQIAGEDITQ